MIALYMLLSAVSSVIFVAVNYVFAAYLASKTGQSWFTELFYVWVYSIAVTPIALLAVVLRFGEKTALLVTGITTYGVFFYAYGIEGILFCAVCTLGASAYLVTINRIAKEI